MERPTQLLTARGPLDRAGRRGVLRAGGPGVVPRRVGVLEAGGGEARIARPALRPAFAIRPVRRPAPGRGFPHAPGGPDGPRRSTAGGLSSFLPEERVGLDAGRWTAGPLLPAAPR